MARSIPALLFKFTSTLITLWVVFTLIEENIFVLIFWASLLTTIINYLLGDLYLLPLLGNITSALIDGLMAGITVYFVTIVIANYPIKWFTLGIFSILISIIEYFFHIYLYKSNQLTS